MLIAGCPSLASSQYKLNSDLLKNMDFSVHISTCFFLVCCEIKLGEYK